MKKRLALTVVAIATFVGVVPAHAGPPNITIVGAGVGSIAHLSVPGSFGYLDQMEVYYSDDHYTHTDYGLARDPRSHIRDVLLWTCRNAAPCHGAPAPYGDRLTYADNDDPGTLNQPYCGCNAAIAFRFSPPGFGPNLQESHYEHGGIPRMEWTFLSGAKVTTIFPSNPRLFDIEIARPWNGPVTLSVDNVD